MWYGQRGRQRETERERQRRRHREIGSWNIKVKAQKKTHALLTSKLLHVYSSLCLEGSLHFDIFTAYSHIIFRSLLTRHFLSEVFLDCPIQNSPFPSVTFPSLLHFAHSTYHNLPYYVFN